MSGFPVLFELKRRHVWRVAVAYAVAGWLLVQIATQVLPFFGIPDWAVRFVVVLLVLGFPVAIIFAWVFELTPAGLRRTQPADSPDARTEHEHRQVGRKLNAIIITTLSLAVVFLGWRLLAVGRAPPPAAASAAKPAQGVRDAAASAESVPAAAFNPPVGTLVVLPFVNVDGDPNQQYFSDGITEELTNALGQNTALRVIAWDTASHYRDSKQSANDIGKALNVANVLTGRIMRRGDSMRVIVELASTTSGYQVWSHHYDDSLRNIFRVQDRISQAIAAALKVEFGGVSTAFTVDPEAHDLVLKARALMQSGFTAAPFERARKLFERAIALDPGYADAHAGLARAWLNLTQVSTLPIEQALPDARREAHKALALNPRSVIALVALAVADASDGHVAEARAKFERALELDPSNAAAHLDYALVLPVKSALAQDLEAVQLDPANAAAQNNLALDYLDLGRYAQSLPPQQALIKLAPHSVDNALGLALTYALLHRDEDAVRAFEQIEPDTLLGKDLAAAGRMSYQSVLDPRLHDEALKAVDQLRQRADLDPSSMYDVIQLYLVLGRRETALNLLPKMCAGTPVGCSDLSVNPVYLPLRADPRFQNLVKQYDIVSKPQ